MNEKTAKANRPAATSASKKSSCPWESGQLGTDIRFARVAPASLSQAVDKALGLVEVSTRVSTKQSEKMENAAARAGLCLKAWLRMALVKGLSKSKKKKSKNKKSKNK